MITKKSIYNLQSRCNFLMNTDTVKSEIKLDRLKVDGVYGPKTKAVEEAILDIVGDTLFICDDILKNRNPGVKYQNQGETPFCSVFSAAMVMSAHGIDITGLEFNDYIDNCDECTKIAASLGFDDLIDLKKTEQISQVLAKAMCDVSNLNFRVKYLTKEEIKKNLLLTSDYKTGMNPMVFATSFTKSGHYVMGYAIDNDNIFINDPYGAYNISTKKYGKDKNGEGLKMNFDSFLTLCKNDGVSGKYRIVCLV